MSKTALKAFVALSCSLAFGATSLWAADYVAEPVAEAVQLNGTPKVFDSGFTVQGLIQQEGTFESNPLLLIGDRTKSLYGSITQPEIIVKDSTPETQLTADTLVDGNVFNQTPFDSVDLHSTAGIVTGNERWSGELAEKTDYDTTRSSELSSFNLTTRPFRHFSTQISPTVSFSPSQIDKLTLAGSASTSQYQSTVFSDYNVYNLTPTYVHDFDPRNAGVIAVQAQDYQTTDNRKTRVESLGPSVGWITALTPDLSAKATVGVQKSHQSGRGTSSQSSGLQYIFSGDVTYKGTTDTADFLASRSEYPLGDGTEGLLTTISLSDVHPLNANLALNLGAIYQSSEYQSGFSGNLESQVGGNVGLIYRVTDHLDLSGTYQYRHETLSGINGTAQDHLLTVALVYRLDAWSF